MLFKPTYLYIKQHTVTDKLYFGKTTKSDPIDYFGSGKHWKNHIKKHGKEHVITLWYCLFYNENDCVTFALNFSEHQNIVSSKYWLNLKVENGKDGSPIGAMHSDATKLKIGLASSKRIITPEHKEKLNAGRRGSVNSAEHNARISANFKDRIFSEVHKDKLKIAWSLKPFILCPHCNFESKHLGNMNRYHLDNCKLKY